MVTELTPAMDRSRLPTFPEVLGDWAVRTPDRRAYLFLSDGEREESSLTFAELRDAAFRVANRLSAVVAPGDRVLLFYPSGLDFVVAFLGCLCAGVVAVPVSVPNRKRGLEIVAGIAADSEATCILSVGSLLARYEEDFSGDAALVALPRFDTALWSADGSSQDPAVEIRPNTLALLQYTSGSTGAPRGVVVTHANLSDNHLQQQTCFHHDERTVVVSWLPMFHDMGLGTVLQALWSGADCVLMPPSAFLQKPARWLQAISRYRGTFSGAPDFAFDLCARRITAAERDGLDLSSWRGAYNGSEPVRFGSLSRFSEVFSVHGFRWEYFHPVYGLAEATAFVTGADLGQGPIVQRFSRAGLERGKVEPDPSDRSAEFVGCGRAWLDSSVAVVDPESLKESAPGQIGEIWVRGGSVAAGYWRKDDETRRIFHAYTASGAGPFLRTGDLGFLHQENLFVTGRSKDLIIVRGRNHYPQDIENTVAGCHPSLEPGRCGAFSVDTEDGESLVVVQEVRRTALRELEPDEVFRAIRNAVADRHGLSAAAIVLLRPLALPRTTSGKVRRKACREDFLSQSLAAVASAGFTATNVDEPTQPALPVPVPSSGGEDAATRLVHWLRQYPWKTEDTEIRRKPVSPETLSDLAREGLLGMQVGSDHGGLALGHGDTVRVLEQLGGVDLGASLFVGLNNYLGVWPILRHGQLRLQQELLPQLAQGKRLAGFALAEPGGGSNPETWSSHADAVNGSGWRLFGKKFLSSGTPESGLLNVFVRHPDRQGVTGFVVARGAAGVGHVDRLSEHGVARDGVNLDGVFVQPQHVLGQLGQGMEVAFDAIRHSHLAIGAACLGGMKRCSQLIFQHATQRQTPDAGLVAHPVTMTRLGRITAEATALECLVRLLAEEADSGRDLPSEAFTVCKLIGPEMLWQAVDDLVQLLGRRGLVETLQLRQLVEDAHVLRGLEGPTEAGSALLGAGLMSGDLERLRSLGAESWGVAGMGSLIEEAVDALRERARTSSRSSSAASIHWLHARAGELATWVLLWSAVERQRSVAPSADLARAAMWLRSNLDSTLVVTKAGPPPEAKIDARAYASLGSSAAPALRGDEASGRGIQNRDLKAWAVSWLAERLRVDESHIQPHRSFADHGVDSLAAVEFAKALADKLGISLDETLLWNFPTIDALLGYLEDSLVQSVGLSPPSRFPGPDGSGPKGAPSADVSSVEEELDRLERELRKRP